MHTQKQHVYSVCVQSWNVTEYIYLSTVLCVCLYLQHVHRSSSKGDRSQQCWRKPGLRAGWSHQTLTVDEEVDEGEGVRSLHTHYRLRLVVQSDGVALLTTAAVGQRAWTGCYHVKLGHLSDMQLMVSKRIQLDADAVWLLDFVLDAHLLQPGEVAIFIFSFITCLTVLIILLQLTTPAIIVRSRIVAPFLFMCFAPSNNQEMLLSLIFLKCDQSTMCVMWHGVDFRARQSEHWQMITITSVD